MKKLSKGMRGLIIGLAAVAVLGGGLGARSVVTKRRAAAAAAGAAETVTLQRSNLTQSINVSGVVASAETTNIYSTMNYPVKEIFVEVGDTVEAGDVLAVLDTATLENDIAQAEINYNGAKTALSDAVTNAQTSLAAAKITLEQRQMAAANAEKDLGTAQTDAAKPFDSATYDRAVNEARITLERKVSDNRSAQADYMKAVLNFDDYRYQNAVTDARIALDRRQADLAAAQKDYGDALTASYNAPEERDAALAKAQKAYDTANNAADDAQRALGRAQTDLTRAKDDAVKAARDKADAAARAEADARRACDKAVNDKSRAANDSKEANAKKVESAEKALADAKKQLEAAQNSVKSAENSLSQAQAKPGSAGKNVDLQALTLEKLNRQLDSGQIIAEAGGVITAVNAKVGAAPSGVLFVIDNKDALYVSARVKEYNLNTLFIGQEITITTDATGSKKCGAALSYISPKAVSEAGSTSVEFEIRAALTDPDDAIKIGMNAFLNIIQQTKENVYAVPVSAVVTDGRGSFIYAMPDRAEIPVTLGIKTSTSVEIAGGGLRDGLQILTDPEGKLSDGQERRMGFGPMGR